jgi:hypothetical protein
MTFRTLLIPAAAWLCVALLPAQEKGGKAEKLSQDASRPGHLDQARFDGLVAAEKTREFGAAEQFWRQRQYQKGAAAYAELSAQFAAAQEPRLQAVVPYLLLMEGLCLLEAGQAEPACDPLAKVIAQHPQSPSKLRLLLENEL